MIDDIEDMTAIAIKRAKRLIKVVVGFTLLGIGIALIVLPGPAFVVIPVALAILAGEFVWAKKLLARFKEEYKKIVNFTSNSDNQS